MKLQKYIILIFFSCICLQSCEEIEFPPVITYPEICYSDYFIFAYTHPGYVKSIIQSNDSGFIVSCPISYFDSANIIKYDDHGLRLWDTIFNDNVGSLDKTPDGNIIFISGDGYSYSQHWLRKINSSGNIIWSQSVPGGKPIATNDNGVLLLSSLSPLQLKKYTASGSEEWEFNSQDTFYSFYSSANNYMFQDIDNGYVIASHTTTTTDYYNTIYKVQILKIDQFGNFKWKITPDFTGNLTVQSIVKNSDGHTYTLLLNNTNHSSTFNNTLAKIDSSGAIIWEKTFSDEQRSKKLLSAPNDEYIIAGEENVDLFLSKWNSSGDLIWKKFYGGDGKEEINDLIYTFDGYAIIGQTTNYAGPISPYDFTNTRTQFYFIKTDEQGETCY